MKNGRARPLRGGCILAVNFNVDNWSLFKLSKTASFEKDARAYISRANRRIKALAEADLLSAPSLEGIKRRKNLSDTDSYDRFYFKAPKNRTELVRELQSARDFMQMETSTVSGAKTWRRNVDQEFKNRIFGGYKEDGRQRYVNKAGYFFDVKKFWDIYPRVNQQLLKEAARANSEEEQRLVATIMSTTYLQGEELVRYINDRLRELVKSNIKTYKKY